MDIIRGITICKNQTILILIISLIASILSAYIIPPSIKASVSTEDINQQLEQLSPGASSMISIDVSAVVASTQTLSTSIILFILAYIVKYIIDKKLFNIKSFRDWKFFIYSSAFPTVLMDVAAKISFFSNPAWQSDFVISLIVNIIFSFMIVFFSALLLPEIKNI